MYTFGAFPVCPMVITIPFAFDAFPAFVMEKSSLGRKTSEATVWLSLQSGFPMGKIQNHGLTSAKYRDWRLQQLWLRSCSHGLLATSSCLWWCWNCFLVFCRHSCFPKGYQDQFKHASLLLYQFQAPSNSSSCGFAGCPSRSFAEKEVLNHVILQIPTFWGKQKSPGLPSCFHSKWWREQHLLHHPPSWDLAWSLVVESLVALRSPNPHPKKRQAGGCTERWSKKRKVACISTSMYIYVCMYVCIYIYIYIHISMCIHSVYIYIYYDVCVCVCVYGLKYVQYNHIFGQS